MEIRKALLSIAAITIVILFIGMPINPIQTSSVEHIEKQSKEIAGNATPTSSAIKAYSLLKESNIKFMYTKTLISGSGEYKVLHVETVYSYSSAVTVSEMGGNKTSFFHGVKVTVNFKGHKMYINSSAQINQKINLRNVYHKNVHNNPLIVTDSMPGNLYFNIYTKSLSGYNALLAVTRVGVPQLAVYSAATVGVMLGEVVAYEEVAIITIQPEASGLLPYTVAILSANTLVLYGYAIIHHDQTIYIDL